MSRAGEWPSEAACGTLTLSCEARHRRRTRLRTDDGGWLLLDLPEAARMRDGDGIRLESGGWLLVRAAAETLAEITCDTPQRLARIAWHLGNRHLPLEVEGRRLRIRDDHVATEMVRRLGGRVRTVEAPFEPEAGAYTPHPEEGQGHAG